MDDIIRNLRKRHYLTQAEFAKRFVLLPRSGCRISSRKPNEEIFILTLEIEFGVFFRRIQK